MNTYGTSTVNSERPSSSARVSDYENSNYDSLEKRSKIPKMPKRTYSLEEKKSSCLLKRSNTRTKTSTTSMIPRPEWKKQNKKLPTEKESSNGSISEPPVEPTVEKPELPVNDNPVPNTASFHSSPSATTLTLEKKINKDLVSFKNSVLRIPEYWTDAGETVTSILKNAVNIITKQYPTADVESFEKDIESILKATETVKQQILSRTENIINKASQIYTEKNERNPAMGDEDLKVITRKISDLKNEVHYRKNVFGDLLKYGSEMRQLLELEKSLKSRAPQKQNSLKDPLSEIGKSENEVGGHVKQSEERKWKVGTETVILQRKKSDKHSLHSCGDIARQGTKILLETDIRSEFLTRPSAEDKGTQTMYSWFEELRKKEKDLRDLNKQILDLHQLCKEHISKFKNFNLQIKMRGICNKSQHSSSAKDVFVYNENKVELLERNSSSIGSHNKIDLKSTVNQKDLDIQYKEKLMNQKKLLHMREELIGMLKNRCSSEEQRRY